METQSRRLVIDLSLLCLDVYVDRPNEEIGPYSLLSSTRNRKLGKRLVMDCSLGDSLDP